jgi:hypothetical protein
MRLRRTSGDRAGGADLVPRDVAGARDRLARFLECNWNAKTIERLAELLQRNAGFGEPMRSQP